VTTIFPDDMRPDFEGFTAETFRFLRGLARNNERGWFTARKSAYESAVKFPMECLAAAFGRDRQTDLPVQGDPAKAMFRIYRDVRFARDKSPYKTHAGAVLSRSGRRGDPGIVYIHIEPGGCFIGAGFYRLEAAHLAAWRAAMVEAPQDFLDLMAPFDAAGAVAAPRLIEPLKTMPRGYAAHAESPIAPYLRWKSFLVARTVADAETRDPGFIARIREVAVAATPLLEYGWQLIDRAGEDDPRRHMAVRR
jgi:uncharacterized protein (TIGR02453 family)